MPKTAGALTTDPVVIIGGGFAGLVAAKELKRNKIPFVLFEGGKNIGGLAQTFTDEQGFKYDLGTHIITNRLARKLGITDQCRDVLYFGESIWLNGRLRSYPFGLLGNKKYLIDALRSRLRFPLLRRHENLQERFIQEYGKAFATEVAIPLIEGLTGSPAHTLAADVGDKLPGIFRTIYLKLGGLFTGKAIAIGYCRELPESWNVWHVYPNEGIKMLSERLAAEVNDHIQLNADVSRIIVGSDGVKGVEVNENIIPTSVVISTAPVNILSQLIDGANDLSYLYHFQYSGMICVTIMCEGKRILPDATLWTPEDRYSFFRLTEPSYSMPWVSPPGKSVITADIGCKPGDNSWDLPDEDWYNAVLIQLSEIIPGIRKCLLGYKVLRVKFAYPIYYKQYEPLRRQFIKTSGVKGLYSIGRNGEFSHLLMEDVYVRTIQKMKEVISICKY
ncbi:NAD(P)/FAD-dependent oxidoreductase [Chitinophaga sp. GbtcB8]|uniref:protoporphyrinogen/coproporphyrinogen oxidase n=1 Tax=Chitinophaga sp. GbtcB8 TaxID=2824753 RepID=UPI001C2FD0B6|nr:FAD-dependent oxidoreductase [Chitinophaga sp. GbtcB8]